MTDKELRKLSRRDLLEMMLRQSEEIRELKEKLNKAETELRDRQIRVDQCGTLAEASLQLNGVFDAAHAASRQYLDNIENLSQRQEKICERMIEESRAEADAILKAAARQQVELEYATALQCAQMKATAKAEAQAYWDEVYVKMQTAAAGNSELARLLSNLKRENKG